MVEDAHGLPRGLGGALDHPLGVQLGDAVVEVAHHELWMVGVGFEWVGVGPLKGRAREAD